MVAAGWKDESILLRSRLYVHKSQSYVSSKSVTMIRTVFVHSIPFKHMYCALLRPLPADSIQMFRAPRLLCVTLQRMREGCVLSVELTYST